MVRAEHLGELPPAFVPEKHGNANMRGIRRWLTHSISEYYGLESKSVSIGNPAQRVVYVGLRRVRHSKEAARAIPELPPPMWELF
jgi:hypothetical protein